MNAKGSSSNHTKEQGLEFKARTLRLLQEQHTKVAVLWGIEPTLVPAILTESEGDSTYGDDRIALATAWLYGVNLLVVDESQSQMIMMYAAHDFQTQRALWVLRFTAAPGHFDPGCIHNWTQFNVLFHNMRVVPWGARSHLTGGAVSFKDFEALHAPARHLILGTSLAHGLSQRSDVVQACIRNNEVEGAPLATASHSYKPSHELEGSCRYLSLKQIPKLDVHLEHGDVAQCSNVYDELEEDCATSMREMERFDIGLSDSGVFTRGIGESISDMRFQPASSSHTGVADVCSARNASMPRKWVGRVRMRLRRKANAPVTNDLLPPRTRPLFSRPKNFHRRMPKPTKVAVLADLGTIHRRVATLNVGSLYLKRFLILSLLQDSDIDIMCLQETHVTANNQLGLERFFGDEGWKVVWGCPTPMVRTSRAVRTASGDVPGVATLYRASLSVHVHPFGFKESNRYYQQGRLQLLSFKLQDGSLVLLLNLYAHSGAKRRKERLDMLASLVDEVATHGHAPIMIAGDYNTTPEATTLASTMLQNGGRQPTYVTPKGGRPAYTYRCAQVRSRIDGFLVSCAVGFESMTQVVTPLHGFQHCLVTTGIASCAPETCYRVRHPLIYKKGPKFHTASPVDWPSMLRKVQRIRGELDHGSSPWR
eukprot:6404246-Amphidinium_carterae.1